MAHTFRLYELNLPWGIPRNLRGDPEQLLRKNKMNKKRNFFKRLSRRSLKVVKRSIRSDTLVPSVTCPIEAIYSALAFISRWNFLIDGRDLCFVPPNGRLFPAPRRLLKGSKVLFRERCEKAPPAKGENDHFRHGTGAKTHKRKLHRHIPASLI